LSTTEEVSRVIALPGIDHPLAGAHPRTLEIIEHRRTSRSPRRRGWLIRRGLVVADLVGLTIAFTVSEAISRVGRDTTNLVATRSEVLLFLLTLPLWIGFAKLYGLYDRDEERADHSTTDELIGVLHLVTVGSWVVYVGAQVTGLASPGLLKLWVFWTVAVAAMTIARTAARALCRRHWSYLQNTIIVGAGEVGQLIARKLLQHPEYGINLVGFVDEHPKERHPGLQHLTLLGGRDQLASIIDVLDVERVIVAFSNDADEQTLELVRELGDRDLQIDIVPRMFDVVGTNMDIHTVEGLPLVGLRRMRLSRSARAAKRLTDVVLSGIGLLVLSPVFVVIAIAIKLESRGPVFFRQVRMGCEGTFRIWKFRTMVVDAEWKKAEVAHLNQHARNGGDPRMFKIPDDPRTTRVGRFLRQYSYDELPQLINVFVGQMSLVGPRPLILEEHRFVQDWAQRRLQLKPGITGLWQVLGRSHIPFEEMVKLDYLYVTGWSLFNDLCLLLRTVPVLMRPSAQ
jgi:exopolysaccharide biosynthesis polyprenyl glycosylphosphotransferase